jgi:ribosomal protein S7
LTKGLKRRSSGVSRSHELSGDSDVRASSSSPARRTPSEHLSLARRTLPTTKIVDLLLERILSIKTIAECLADEIISAGKGSSNSYAGQAFTLSLFVN